MIDYKNITNQRQFKAATGKSRQEFELLSQDLVAYYCEEYGRTYEEYIEEEVYETPKLKHLEEALFFVLFQMKNDMTWDSLGAVFKMSGGAAHTNFKTFSGLLEDMLEKKNDAQKRVQGCS